MVPRPHSSIHLPTTAPEPDVTTVSVMLTNTEIEQLRRRAKERSAFPQKEFKKPSDLSPRLREKPPVNQAT